MTKIEFISMVGKNRIGSWWTWERTMAVVCLATLVVFVLVGSFNTETQLWSIGIGAMISLLGLMLGGMLSPRGRKVFTTPLMVKEFKGRKVKVLGQDGQEHELWYDKEEFFFCLKKTIATINHRVNRPRVILLIGKNISQIWK